MNTQTISLQYNIKIAKNQIFGAAHGDRKESIRFRCGDKMRDTYMIPVARENKNIAWKVNKNSSQR